MPPNIRVMRSESPYSSDDDRPQSQSYRSSGAYESRPRVRRSENSKAEQESTASSDFGIYPSYSIPHAHQYEYKAAPKPRADPIRKEDLQRAQSLSYQQEAMSKSQEAEVEERLTQPQVWLQRLENLQDLVYLNSGLHYYLKTAKTAPKNQRVPIPFPEDRAMVPFISRDVEVHNAIARGAGPARGVELRQLLDSVAITVRALVSMDYMREARFMSDGINALVLDRSRKGAATMVTIRYSEIYSIARSLDAVLGYEVNDSTAVTWSREDLFNSCSLLVSKFWGLDPVHRLNPGQLWLLTARTIDMAVVSYSRAHVGSTEGSSNPEDEIELLPGGQLDTLCCRKRSLACLDAFLNGEKAWVFEVKKETVEDPKPLYISTTMNELADIWGPAWKSIDPTFKAKDTEKRKSSKISTSYQPPKVEDADSSDSSGAFGFQREATIMHKKQKDIMMKKDREAVLKMKEIDEEHKRMQEREAYSQKKMEEQRIKLELEIKRMKWEMEKQREKSISNIPKAPMPTHQSLNQRQAVLYALSGPTLIPGQGYASVEEEIRANYFHLGHGMILPWDRTKDEPQLGLGETLCHWTSDPENLSRWNTQRNKFPLIRGTDRLLIGAGSTFHVQAGKALLPNSDCRKNEQSVHQNLKQDGLLGENTIVFPAIHLDAMGVNAGLGFQGATLGGQMIFKRAGGSVLREVYTTSWKQWHNAQWLKSKIGIEVSFCTHHARRVSLFHLLSSSSMRNCLEWANYPWPETDCKEKYFSALEDESVADFRALQRHSDSWREAVNNAVSTCLEAIGNIEKADSNWIRAFWVPDGDDFGPCTVSFNKSTHDWAGLVKDSPVTGAFTVVSNKCLKLDRESERCGACPSATLETAMIINVRAKLAPEIRDHHASMQDRRWKVASFSSGDKLRFKEGELKVTTRLKHRLVMQWKGQVWTERSRRDQGRPRKVHWEAVSHIDDAPGFAECRVPLFVVGKDAQFTDAPSTRTSSSARRSNQSPPPSRQQSTRRTQAPLAPLPTTQPSLSTPGVVHAANNTTQPQMTERPGTRPGLFSPDRLAPNHTTTTPITITPTSHRYSSSSNMTTTGGSVPPTPTSHTHLTSGTRTRPLDHSTPRSPSPTPSTHSQDRPHHHRRRRRHRHRHHRPSASPSDASIPDATPTIRTGRSSWGDATWGGGRTAARRERGSWWRGLCCAGWGSGSSEMR